MSETPILPPGFTARMAAQSAIPQVQSSQPQPAQIKQAETPSSAEVKAETEPQDSSMLDAGQEEPSSTNAVTDNISSAAIAQAPPIYSFAPQRLNETNSRSTSQQPESRVEKQETSSPAPTVAIPHGAPVRQYLNSKVTGPVLEGMKILARDQPPDPLRWLAEFLMERSREFGEDQN